LLRDPRRISLLYLSGCNDGSDFAGFDVQEFHVPMDTGIPVSPIDGYDSGGGLTPSKLPPGGEYPLFQRICVYRDYHPFPVPAVVEHDSLPTRTPLLAGSSMGIFHGDVSSENPDLTGPPFDDVEIPNMTLRCYRSEIEHPPSIGTLR
jgi:hypothetical protein